MKKLIEKYVFDPAQKNIVFNDYTSIELERVLLITNVTKNIIIYNFANPLVGAQVVNNNILHLQYDTATMSNTDKLQIFYEEDMMVATEGAQTELYELMYSTYTALKDLSSILTTIHGGAMRVAVSTMPGVAVSTMPAMTFNGTQNVNATSIGGAQAHTIVANSHNSVFQHTINNIKEV